MIRNKFLYIFFILSFIVFQMIMAADVGDALQLLSYKVTPSTRPNVTDGLIGAGADPRDWAAAYVRRMTVAVDGDLANESRNLTMLIANDSDTLYIAVAVELASTAVLNRATLYFDQGTRGVLDGSSGSPGEYYVTLQANGNPPSDGHWDGSAWTANGTSKAEGFGARRGSGGLHIFNFEFKMPINEAGDASNGYLNLTAGDEVGILIKVTDNTGKEFFWYQTNAEETDPSATGGNGKTEWAEIQTIGRGIADRDVVSLFAKGIVPTIDGDISGDSEWRYAFDKDIIFTDFAGNKINGSIKIKEQVSPDNLLFGVTLESTAPIAADYMALYFDQGGTGGDLNYILTEGGDTRFDHASRVLGNSTYQDYYFDTSDWVVDGSSEGSGAAGSSGGDWEVEFSIPLASGDANDLDITSGDELGLLLQYYDNTNSRSYWWSATINSEKVELDPDDVVFNALGWGFLQTGGPFLQPIYPEDGDTLSGEYPLAIYALDPSDPVPEMGIESIGYEIRKEDASTGTVTILLRGDLTKIEDDDLAIWTGTVNTRSITESSSTLLRLVYRVYDGELDTLSVPIDIYINNEGGTSGVDDPTIRVTSPTPNSVLSGAGVSVSFSVDTQSPLTLDTVRVFIDGNLMQTYTPSSTSSYSNTYSWNTATFPDGEHIIQIWAVNSIGLENFSPTILVTTENAPSVTITSPTASSLVQGTVTVNFTATPVAPSTLSTTEISVDGGTWSAVTSAPPGAGGAGSHSWDTAALPDGTHTIQVRTTDNNSKTGLSDLISVVVDNRPPVGSLTATPDEVKDGDTIAFAYNGAEAGLTAVIPLAQIQLLDDQASSLLSLTDADNDGIYRANYTIDAANGVGDGVKTLTATITDAVNNTFNPQVTITLDNTAPGFVSLANLDPDNIYTNGETILLLATFDAAGYIVSCDFNAMDIAYVTGAETVEDNGDGTYTIRYTLSETNTRSNGSYVVTATATDGVGLTDSGNISLLLDNSGPVISNLALADADDILNADDTITATVTDNDANIQAAEYFVDVIGVAGEGTLMSAVDGTFDSLIENVTTALSIASLSEGQHTLFVRGQDESGKWGAVSSLSFTVDRVAPMITTITVEYPAGQTAARNGQVITISALLYEATTQLDPASILLRSALVDNNSSTGYVMVDDGTSGDAVSGDGIYTSQLTVTSTSTGTFNFTIDAADIVSNNNQITSDVSLDNTAPGFVSLANLDPDNIYTNGETILLLATFDAAGYTVSCDFNTMDIAYIAGSETVEDNGDGTYTIRYTLSETNTRSNGSYTVTTTATDGVGLTDSGNISLLLDNSGPVISNLALADADDILNADDIITATVTDNNTNIQRAEFFVDVVGVAGEGTAMTAADGDFDSLIENVTAALSIASLSEGQHMLYVRGQDESGRWGAVSSLSFTVDRVPPFISSVEIVYPDGQTAARNGQDTDICIGLRRNHPTGSIHCIT